MTLTVSCTTSVVKGTLNFFFFFFSFFSSTLRETSQSTRGDCVSECESESISRFFFFLFLTFSTCSVTDLTLSIIVGSTILVSKADTAGTSETGVMRCSDSDPIFLSLDFRFFDFFLGGASSITPTVSSTTPTVSSTTPTVPSTTPTDPSTGGGSRHRFFLFFFSFFHFTSVGTDDVTEGTSGPLTLVFSFGADVFPFAADVFPFAADVFAKGADVFAKGADKFAKGADVFPFGADVFSFGAEAFPDGDFPSWRSIRSSLALGPLC